MEIVALNRTLDQEVLALLRGASLECPACGEFVLHAEGAILCLECGSGFPVVEVAPVQLGLQAG